MPRSPPTRVPRPSCGSPRMRRPGDTIHVIAEASDDAAEYPLKAYQRVILTVTAA